MSQYIVFKKHTHEIPNEVHFQYALEDAIAFADKMNLLRPEAEWVVAEIYDERKWYVKLLFWLGHQVNGSLVSINYKG